MPSSSAVVINAARRHRMRGPRHVIAISPVRQVIKTKSTPPGHGAASGPRFGGVCRRRLGPYLIDLTNRGALSAAGRLRRRMRANASRSNRCRRSSDGKAA